MVAELYNKLEAVYFGRVAMTTDKNAQTVDVLIQRIYAYTMRYSDSTSS
jgi:hypothetical protein